MPKFIVHVVDTRTRRYFKEFEAATEDEARSLAEGENWADFTEDIYADSPMGETYIDWIEDKDERFL